MKKPLKSRKLPERKGDKLNVPPETNQTFIQAIKLLQKLTGRKKGIIKNSLITIVTRLKAGKNDLGGTLQTTFFRLLYQENPRMTETLGLLPISNYYPRK